MLTMELFPTFRFNLSKLVFLVGRILPGVSLHDGKVTLVTAFNESSEAS
jgi:hypothetical protein